MKFKDLEKLVNDRITERELYDVKNETYYESNVSQVGKLMYEILEERGIDRDFYIQMKRNGAELVDTKNPKFTIWVTIKRKKGTPHHSFWSSVTMYMLDKIEIETDDDYTLEQWYENCRNAEAKKIKDREDSIEEFIKILKEKNISKEEWDKLSNTWDKYQYYFMHRLSNELK